MGRKVIKKETPEISEAFEYYYAMGEKRSLAKTAEHVGRTSTTLLNWSASFNWQERIKQKEIEYANNIHQRNIKEVVTAKANYRKIFNNLVKKFIDNMQAGKVKMETISDLERVIKMDLLLMGEITENTQIVQSHSIRESDKQLIDRVCTSLERMYGDVDDGDIIEPKQEDDDLDIAVAEVVEDDSN